MTLSLISCCNNLITVPHLIFQPIAVNVLYWKENVHGISSIDKNPTFVISGHKETTLRGDFYGLPADEYPNHYKVSYAGEYEIYVTPGHIKAAIKLSRTPLLVEFGQTVL
jgi:hypothetical protein